MSYCRQGADSDVYVIRTGPTWVCFDEAKTFISRTREEMIIHLTEHKLYGDKVPFRAIERLWNEIDGGSKAQERSSQGEQEQTQSNRQEVSYPDYEAATDSDRSEPTYWTRPRTR